MAKLNISLEGNSLGEFNLDKERVTIGRRVGNDIHIDNLAVSGEHAVITTIGNDSFLQDLDSTNGTLVNNKPIKKHVLHHADIMEFGRYHIEYVNLAQQKSLANASGFENTAVIRPAKQTVVASVVKLEDEKNLNTPTPAASKENATHTASLTSASALVPDLASAPVVITSTAIRASAQPVVGAQILGHLKVLIGDNVGHELLLNKALTTLGKPGVQVAVITKRPHGYFISHLEGKKMPLVNGLTIGAQAHALANRDVIDLEGVKMEFYQV